MYSTDILISSENSLLIQFEKRICPEVNSQVLMFVDAFETETRGLPEIIETVPTYCSVTVFFDEKLCNHNFPKKIAEKILKGSLSFREEKKEKNRTIKIPVCYEDEEFAPDLEKISTQTGLSKKEIIELHSSTEYLIYMLGFLPGFPYLGGIDERLEIPRLETPRKKIQAGSVAVGGKQTGLYPVESPGGWLIIGRTPLKVFDAERNPSFLYESGDKIRFVPVSRNHFDNFNENLWLNENTTKIDVIEEKTRFVCGSGIRIIDPGLNTTVQDMGIFGFQKYGIGQCGAMDELSFKMANMLCGNLETVACLETTLSGPEIQFILPCDFAITGAVFENANLDDKHIEMNRVYHAGKGSVLKCGYSSYGLRSYIAFSGGVLVHKKFGSSSTNTKIRTGGYKGRKLMSGDEIAIGKNKNNEMRLKENYEMNPFFIQKEEIVSLQCVRSSQTDFFTQDIISAFMNNIYTVTPDSDRMGIRFSGKSLACGKTDIISDAVPFGAVQITSEGLPVVMASDRQTTGGYAKIACVTKKSMCKLSQAVPGTKVQFSFI